MEFIEYSKCSTCKKAKKYLDDNNIKYTNREIKEKCPTIKEITNWINSYNIDINKLFNTSGLVYRSMNLKDKLKELKVEDKIKLLSENPMLIKRPILVTNSKILVGFKEADWNESINN